MQALRYETLSSEEEKLTENTVDNLLEESIENQNSDTPPTQGTPKFNVLSLYCMYIFWLTRVIESIGSIAMWLELCKSLHSFTCC